MLTGKRAFDGEEITDVLARIIQRDPDFAAPPMLSSRDPQLAAPLPGKAL